MTPRRVRVPAPAALVSMVVTGPISSRASSSPEGASLSLFNTLADAAEAELRVDGWCVWWASSERHAGNVVRVDLWFDDDTGGGRSAETVQRALEDSGFFVQPRPRPSAPDALSRGPGPLHAREGTARVGRLYGDLPVDFEWEEGRTGVDVERRRRWKVQACPRCGRRGHPVERLAGYPGADALLAAELGEVSLTGCGVDDDDADAECSSCGFAFTPRGPER